MVVRVVPNTLRAVAVLGKLTQPMLELLGFCDPAESLVLGPEFIMRIRVDRWFAGFFCYSFSNP